MNWVGGARNRLKLKHENKLQKEFFERKRQQKSNARTVTPKRVDKMKGRGSQDLFSLEVIMSAHRDVQRRRNNEGNLGVLSAGEGGTSCSQGSGKASCKQSGKKSFPGKELQQHIIPELSPVRQHSQPQLHLQQDKHGYFCSSQSEGDCIFSNACLESKMSSETLVHREYKINEEEIHQWKTT